MPGETRLDARLVVADARERPRLDVTFAISNGVTVVMGPSGAGKTTLLLALAGLVRPREGRIALAGETIFDVAAKIDRPTHRRRVALVFQSLALFPHLSVAQNVGYGIAGGTKAERRASAASWMERARVGHLADRRPASLSGGEAQRVAFARALASSPRLLLLDEPFSAMDPALRAELRDELRSLVTDASIPAILVTHDERDAERLADRMIRIERGLIVGGSAT